MFQLRGTSWELPTDQSATVTWEEALDLAELLLVEWRSVEQRKLLIFMMAITSLGIEVLTCVCTLMSEHQTAHSVHVQCHVGLTNIIIK